MASKEFSKGLAESLRLHCVREVLCARFYICQFFNGMKHRMPCMYDKTYVYHIVVGCYYNQNEAVPCEGYT